MTLTANLVKGGAYALLIGLLAIDLFVTISSSKSTNISDEYARNLDRIERQYAEYSGYFEQSMVLVSGLQETLGEVTGRLESVESGLEELSSGQREIGDSALEIGLLSDRNDRLIKELSRRSFDGETKE